MQGKNRDSDIENRLMDTAGVGEGDERVALKYMHYHM